jgi:hypothetical protein
VTWSTIDESAGRLSWFGLGTGALRTMLEVAMLVLGSALVSLGLVVLLDGFSIVEVGLGLSTGAMLGSALVLGIVGAFGFGVASEGGYGAARGLERYPVQQVAVARAVASLIVGLSLWLGGRVLLPYVVDLAYPLQVGRQLLEAVGLAGLLVVPILGVGGAYLAHRSLERAGFGLDVELGLIYLVWVLGVVVATSFP